MGKGKGTLKTIAAALVTVLVIAPACSARSESVGEAASASSALQPEPSVSPADFRSQLAELGKRQQLDVTWTGGPYRYSYDSSGGSAENPSEADVARVSASIVRELGLYPDGFLRRAGLKGIVLVRDLYVQEDGGARGAAAYIFDDRFFLDVPNAIRAIQGGTRIRFIHHLMWHRLDELAGTMWRDPEWEALNPPNFEYGVYSRGGVHETRAGSGSLSTQYPGFLNLYSTGNLPDDKAEVYAYLMVIHSWVGQRTRQDPYLGRKVAVIKARLATLDPNFDERFWNRVNADSDEAARYGDGR